MRILLKRLFVIIGFIGIFPTIYGDNKRSSPEGQFQYNIELFRTASGNINDDTALFSAALAEIGENHAELILISKTYIIDNIVIPENITIKFMPGAMINVKTSLCINGNIETGVNHIFTGNGSVAGNIKCMNVLPQWFGAKGDGCNDDSEAIQKAADLAKNSLGNLLFIPKGQYRFDKNITLKCNVECRGVLFKELKIDPAKSTYSNTTFISSDYPINDPQISILSDAEPISLDPEYFYGTMENDLRVKSYEKIPLAKKPSEKIDLKEGGGLSFFSSDFFTSRKNQHEDEWYDKCDFCQLVSEKGDVFPEFCFSYPRPPDAEEWNPTKTYSKGNYCKVKGKIYKATFQSGPGTSYKNPYKGSIDIGPRSPDAGAKFDFKYSDGAKDSINLWRAVNAYVVYYLPQSPLKIDGLTIEIHFKDNNESKRIYSRTLNISRSNVTFNKLSVSCKNKFALLSSLCLITYSSNLIFNDCYFSGATYHGLGYNIQQGTCSNIIFNNCTSINCRDGLAGCYGKNITVNGGYFNRIDDHYGKNYTIKNVTLYGVSTHVPEYCTPKADLNKWLFIPTTVFAFAGGNIHIENCRIFNCNEIFSNRRDAGDLYGNITLKNIAIENSPRDVCIMSYHVDDSFDYCHKVRTPDRINIENITINEPQGFSIYSIAPRILSVPLHIKDCKNIKSVKFTSDNILFESCTFTNSSFDQLQGTLNKFRNCIFSGKISGLSDTNIGFAIGNLKTKNSSGYIPINYVNKDIFEK